MSEKKILPKNTVPDDKLGKVTGGTDDSGDTTVPCPFCGSKFSGYTQELYNHMEICDVQKYNAPDPNKLNPEDPKPFNPG